MTARERELRRYDRQGALALQRSAFFDLFLEADDTANEQLAGCTVVTIRGPLDHHKGWWCDSYEAILERVAVACASPAPVVLLRIDSPGGQVAGCFDAARQIQARARAAGKRLVAYVDGCACSAGYALASTAERIYASSTAFVGSIGVLITRVDVSARDAAEGTRYALVASGARKADGNAHLALSEDELANMSRECESLAGLFFEAVATLRPQLTVDALRELDAGVFHGPAALAAGLVDELSSFDEALAALSGGNAMSDDQNEQTEERTAGPLDDAREALERAAEGDGDEAARARRALEVLNGGGEDEDEDEGEQAAAAARPPARAARAAAPATVSASSAATLATTVQALAADVAALRAERESVARTAMLAERPDLTPELVARLQAMPVAEARAIVDAIPRPTTPNHAATAVVGATRGMGQGTAPALSPDELRMDREMGIAPDAGGVRRSAYSMEFSVPGERTRAPRAAAPSRGEGGR